MSLGCRVGLKVLVHKSIDVQPDSPCALGSEKMVRPLETHAGSPSTSSQRTLLPSRIGPIDQ